MKLEILGKGSGPDSMVVVVSFNCRKDMEKFQSVYQTIMDLFPQESTPATKRCDHRDYDSDKHGRFCPCGTQMWDAGD